MTHLSPELDSLQFAAEAFCRGLLCIYGQVAPFGAVIEADGEVDIVAPQDFVYRCPRSVTRELVANFTSGVHEHGLLGVALVSTGGIQGQSLPTGPPRIVIHLEAANGLAYSVSIPFEGGEAPNRWEWGEPVVEPTAPFVYSLHL